MNSTGGGDSSGVGGLGRALLGASLLLKGDAAELIPKMPESPPPSPTFDLELANHVPEPAFGEDAQRQNATPADDRATAPAPEPSKRKREMHLASPPSTDRVEASAAHTAVASLPSGQSADMAGLHLAYAPVTLRPPVETAGAGEELTLPSPAVPGDAAPQALTDASPDFAQEVLLPESDTALALAGLAPSEAASGPFLPVMPQPAADGVAQREPLATIDGGAPLESPEAIVADTAHSDAAAGPAPIPEAALGKSHTDNEVERAEAKAPEPHPAAAAPAPVTPLAEDVPGHQKTEIPEPAFGLAEPATPPASAKKMALRDMAPVSMPALSFGRPMEKPGPSVDDARLVQAPLPVSRQGPASAAAQQKFALSGASARMAADGALILDYDDELILQIETSKGEIADTLIAYGTRSGVYLPLGALTRFLDLGIVLSDEGHFASGWFLDEKRTLTIDLRQGALTVQGQEKPLAKGDAVAFDGELYIRAERFADLFPLKLSVDLRAQTIRIETLEPFPFEQRLDREEQREQLGSKPVDEPPRWPREETPWTALSFPLGDVELRAASDNALDSRLEGDLRLAGDLAFMTAQAFASVTTRDGLVGARLELGRRDPDARLLGPLRATEFEIGDVSTTALPLGLRGTSGRGAFVTNTPLERASVFDLIDLRGELPNGYEVELYRNNVLIRSTRRSNNGQFEFLQVPVDYGLNVFRLVFFGPQGQRREEVRRISVGDGRLGEGEFHYSFGAAQNDVNLFGVQGPYFTPSQDYGAWRTTALLEYGLTSGLTLSVAGAWFDSDTGKRWMASSGMRTGIGDIAMKFDVGMQPHGKAAQIGIGGILWGLGYSFNHAEYSGEFVDEIHAFSDEFLKRATDLNFNSTFTLGGGQDPFVIPVSGRFRHVEYADRRTTTDAALRASARVENFLVSNTLDFSRVAKPGLYSGSQLLGSFDLSTLSGSRTNYRGSISYELVPRPKLIAASAEVDHAVDERTLVRGGISQALQGKETQFSLSGIREFGRFTLAFDGSYGVKEGSYSAVLRLGFSFGRNPLTGSLFLYKPGLAASGAVAIRAYRDVNGDRHYGAGDELLPDVEFGAGSQYEKTDAQGMAFLGNLGDGTRTSFQIDDTTLPDIALAPASKGIEIVPRPGRIHVTDFAIQELSEIEGTARFAGNGSQRGVSGLALQLTDANSKVVAATRTESDGFFLFEQVLPGKYTIAIDPGQAARLRIRVTEQESLTVEPGGSVLRRQIMIVSD